MQLFTTKVKAVKMNSVSLSVMERDQLGLCRHKRKNIYIHIDKHTHIHTPTHTHRDTHILHICEME